MFSAVDKDIAPISSNKFAETVSQPFSELVYLRNYSNLSSPYEI
jgi:hypothetical protein